MMLLEASGGGVRPIDAELLGAVAVRAQALWTLKCSRPGWPGRGDAGRLESFLAASESYLAPDVAGSHCAHALHLLARALTKAM
jgi:hypothetical protein